MRWAEAARTPRLLMMAGLSASESLVTLERASIVVNWDWIERWEKRLSLKRIVVGVVCGAVERRRQKMDGRGSEIFWKWRNAYLRYKNGLGELMDDFRKDIRSMGRCEDIQRLRVKRTKTFH
ncbi:hypothetical protein IWZ03DRAFT_382149 [Phyllosticta citriasiana]|uniref:Uncharacterized protein n=1 Tax=Phyllosticta citriasiana TaxID=595635 RepID=A0ABR1KHS0_9PEZI